MNSYLLLGRPVKCNCHPEFLVNGYPVTITSFDYSYILSSSWFRAGLCLRHFNTFTSLILKTLDLDQRADAIIQMHSPLHTTQDHFRPGAGYCQYSGAAPGGFLSIRQRHQHCFTAI